MCRAPAVRSNTEARPRAASERPIGARIGDQVRAPGQRGQARAAEDDSPAVQAGRSIGGPAVDQTPGGGKANRAERHVNQKQPPPAGVGDDHTAGERRDHGRDQSGPDDVGHEPHDLRFVRSFEHDHPADRDHHRAADGLEHSHREQLAEALARRAADRGQGEDRDGRQQHSPIAVAQREPGTERDEHGHGHQIRGDDQAGRRGRDVKRCADPRDRGHDDRPVEELHEEAPGDQQRDVAGTRVAPGRRLRTVSSVGHRPVICRNIARGGFDRARDVVSREAVEGAAAGLRPAAALPR